jgi:hypothetical protein
MALGGCLRPVPSLKGLLNSFHFSQGLTTPMRAKAARVGDPGTHWASIISPLLHPISRKIGANWGPRLRGLDLARSFHPANSMRVLTDALEQYKRAALAGRPMLKAFPQTMLAMSASAVPATTATRGVRSPAATSAA